MSLEDFRQVFLLHGQEVVARGTLPMYVHLGKAALISPLDYHEDGILIRLEVLTKYHRQLPLSNCLEYLHPQLVVAYRIQPIHQS